MKNLPVVHARCGASGQTPGFVGVEMTLIAGDAFGARNIDTPEQGIAEELWTGRGKPRREAGYDRFFRINRNLPIKREASLNIIGLESGRAAGWARQRVRTGRPGGGRPTNPSYFSSFVVSRAHQ